MPVVNKKKKQKTEVEDRQTVENWELEPKYSYSTCSSLPISSCLEKE